MLNCSFSLNTLRWLVFDLVVLRDEVVDQKLLRSGGEGGRYTPLSLISVLESVVFFGGNLVAEVLLGGVAVPLSLYSTGSFSAMLIGFVMEALESSEVAVVGRTFSSWRLKGLRIMGMTSNGFYLFVDKDVAFARGAGTCGRAEVGGYAGDFVKMLGGEIWWRKKTKIGRRSW